MPAQHVTADRIGTSCASLLICGCLPCMLCIADTQHHAGNAGRLAADAVVPDSTDAAGPSSGNGLRTEMSLPSSGLPGRRSARALRRSLARASDGSPIPLHRVCSPGGGAATTSPPRVVSRRRRSSLAETDPVAATEPAKLAPRNGVQRNGIISDPAHKRSRSAAGRSVAFAGLEDLEPSSLRGASHRRSHQTERMPHGVAGVRSTAQRGARSGSAPAMQSGRATSTSARASSGKGGCSAARTLADADKKVPNELMRLLEENSEHEAPSSRQARRTRSVPAGTAERNTAGKAAATAAQPMQHTAEAARSGKQQPARAGKRKRDTAADTEQPTEGAADAEPAAVKSPRTAGKARSQASAAHKLSSGTKVSRSKAKKAELADQATAHDAIATGADGADSDSDFEPGTPTVQRRPPAHAAATASLKPAPVSAKRMKVGAKPATAASHHAAPPGAIKNAARASMPATPGSRGRSTRGSMGTVHLACSAVSPATAALARKAVAALDRAVWYDSEADVAAGTLTHLVVGGDALSGKCLLAAADGADIVTPAWLELCMKERTWLPATMFQAQVRCSGGACLLSLDPYRCRRSPYGLGMRIRTWHKQCVCVTVTQCLGSCHFNVVIRPSVQKAPSWVQTPLVESAALSAAWKAFPESAPFHGLAVHVAAPQPAAAQRAVVISALVTRLGGALCAARACNVCVVCSAAALGAAVPKQKRGKGAGGAAQARKDGAALKPPRCKAGAKVLRDAWVVEAVQSASRPDVDAYVL
jgi:hypothetical protein